MVADILLLILTIIALIFATVVDIKIKEVPNWLSYNLIISALAIRLISAITNQDFNYFTISLIALVIIYAIGSILYHFQIWGGGDSKLLIGLVTVFATPPYFINSKYPFLIILILSILIVGAIYGLLYALGLAIKNKKEFLKQYKKIIQNKKIRIIKISLLALSIVLMILAIIIQGALIKLIIGGIIIILISYTYIWIFAKSVENSCMYVHLPINKLVEGDWVVEDIKQNNKIIYQKKKTGIEKIDIENLKKHKIKTVLVKQGFPFVPSFLIGTILALIVSSI